MLSGQCLCESIKFQVLKEIDAIYQCHCSLCRKQSGTHANHATMIHQDDFKWLNDLKCIHTYKKATGFTSSFCKTCGSPVPNQIGNTSYIWIPLGLLEQPIYPTKRLNFCTSSQANWENLVKSNQEFASLPDWDFLEKVFK